ncbi:molybdopterin adenylyltransferase [Rubellicoccus peritrichatus]|uniref:Molybdopterin adenylyltransferase n=1 Tax=Rubellicoccus peritrichatus TaxID=3080537 RepID=A0AAQ3QQ59_9BACT|nr:molybdopterin adenylyltransferase [Puniceicoccus sp. CR14]WOO39878.1 molybdopterin adenylyltransferase [Puniceicoccus sp. CR14]
MAVHIGIINVSDRASVGVYEPTPGKEVQEFLNECLSHDWACEFAVIADEKALISAEVIRMADINNCCLIFTTGGTGPAKRDVTPEATEAVCDKMLPGFGEAMRQESLKFVPTAILSRQTAGIRKSCLIVNLPGKPKAIRECMGAVFSAIPYCVDLIGGPRLETNPEIIKAFRPRKA